MVKQLKMLLLLVRVLCRVPVVLLRDLGKVLRLGPVLLHVLNASTAKHLSDKILLSTFSLIRET